MNTAGYIYNQKVERYPGVGNGVMYPSSLVVVEQKLILIRMIALSTVIFIILRYCKSFSGTVSHSQVPENVSYLRMHLRESKISWVHGMLL